MQYDSWVVQKPFQMGGTNKWKYSHLKYLTYKVNSKGVRNCRSGVSSLQ